MLPISLAMLGFLDKRLNFITTENKMQNKQTPHQTYPLTAIKKGGGFGAGLLFCSQSLKLLGKTTKRLGTFIEYAKRVNLRPSQWGKWAGNYCVIIPSKKN